LRYRERTRVLISVAVAFIATLLAAAPASASPVYTRLAVNAVYINHYDNPAYGRARVDMWVDELNTVNLAADDIRATTRMVKVYNVTRVQVNALRLETRQRSSVTASAGLCLRVAGWGRVRGQPGRPPARPGYVRGAGACARCC
jgi:hypothetical protein